MPPSSPAAWCLDCSFSWNSAGMAEGLRLVGTCPRCGTGTLAFREELDGPTAATAPPSRGDDDLVPPHLVMGLPRR